VPKSTLRPHLPCIVAFSLPALILAAAQAQLPSAPQPASAQNTEIWNAPHFSLEPKVLYDAATAVAAPEGTNVTIFEEDQHYSFDEQGRIAHVGHIIYKILTEKGAEGWDSLSVGWEPWHEARPEIRVRVIAPDASVHTLDPSTITEEPARGGDYKEYSDGKRLRAPFPAIAAGAVVEEEYSEHENEPFFAPGHVGEFTLGEQRVPVEHTLAVFEAPASFPLRFGTLLLDDLKPVRTESGGRVTYTYEVGRLEGVEPRDPFLPREVAHFPEIRFSTGQSWQTMATEYSTIVDSRTKPEAVKPIVDTLIAGKRTVAEKELAILDYLDREVRYTGIEFGESAIVPHEPADTLAKKYGDCKDKATLMVAMLRAAGIPAYVALLNAGGRMDVPADLPGMGLFDHAIVYVPGNPDLWIDTTDRYARLGELPQGDQGRLALIARPETKALTKTAEATSKDNHLLEKREITLTDNGPANVVEVTQPSGIFESNYRGYYADKPDKDTRENLRGYVRSQYVSEDLTKVDRTDPADLSRQFELTIACDKAKRGYTGLVSAEAAIRLESIFRELPDDLKQKEEPDDKKKKDPDQKQTPRTADWELGAPFTSEWQYRIVPPAGFIPKELPKDATISVGPALLTEKFTAEKNGVVDAQLVFDTVKRRYTVAEATELRNKVVELANGPAILVDFEPEGQALLHEGKVREALASYRSLVARNPNEAVHHLQVANVLLEAGLGEAARSEARLAVKLDPNSAVAERILAEILKRDLVGRELRPGSDMPGAAEAYRAAMRLEPDDDNAEGNLAILLEYDPVGRRYSGQSHMKEAIAEYRKLGQDKLTDLGLTNNLAYALFYGGDYAGALKAAQTLNPEPKALIGASIAALQGSKAGLDEINKRSSDDNGFKETTRVAGEMLMNTRQYQLAADFMQAGAAGDNAAQTMGLASMLRGAKHHEDLQFGNTPADLVKQAFLLAMDPDLTLEKLNALSSRNAQIVMKNEDAKDIKDTLETGKKLNSQLARGDSSFDVTVDIMMEAFDPKMDGNDQTGYRLKVDIPGGPTTTFFVVKEDGKYKLLDTLDKPNSIALEMLDRINAGDLKGAKVLLDWLREDQHLEGGDDPLGGPVFPRFWIKGQSPDARKMKLAAASILVGTKPTAAKGIAILEDAQKQDATETEKTNILLALTIGYSIQENFPRLYDVSSALLKQVPESRFAFMNTTQALLGLGRYDQAMSLADDRLKLLENDTDALQMKAETETFRGNFTAARAWSQKLLDQGKEEAGNYNNMAWYALFMPKVTDADIATAIKATQLSKEAPGVLHTLACLYAASGKPKEAHDMLLRAMDEMNLDEPNDIFWYAFGLIAEQYGEKDVAIADYRKLEKPTITLEIPTSSYTLAQMRLKALGADTALPK